MAQVLANPIWVYLDLNPVFFEFDRSIESGVIIDSKLIQMTGPILWLVSHMRTYMNLFLIKKKGIYMYMGSYMYGVMSQHAIRKQPSRHVINISNNCCSKYFSGRVGKVNFCFRGLSCSELQRMLNDANAGDVIGLPFHGRARSWILHLCLLWLQW